MSEIEPSFDVAKIKSRIKELQGSSLFRGLNALGGLVGIYSSEKREELKELAGRLRVCESRSSMPRCLHCGSESTQQVQFNERGLSDPFVHECGGRLRLAREIPRPSHISYNPRTILLNEEGHRIDPSQEGLASAPTEETVDSQELKSLLKNQTIGGQSVIYGLLTRALGQSDSAIRRIELTYFATAVMAYVYLRFNEHRTMEYGFKEKFLDEYTLSVLEESIPSCREDLPISVAVREYQTRYTVYSDTLNLMLAPERSTSGNPSATLLMQLYQAAMRRSARGHMIAITAASELIQQYIADHIDFVKVKL